jgi:hypothetical protein
MMLLEEPMDDATASYGHVVQGITKEDITSDSSTVDTAVA